jgi:hypothetical protein
VARLARGEVARYLLFDENISNYEFEVALAADRGRWERAAGPPAGDLRLRHPPRQYCGLTEISRDGERYVPSPA